VHQHGSGDSGGLECKAGPKKDAERRDKVSIRAGKETSLGKACESLPNAGDVEKEHRWLVIERNLRDKRSDP